MSPPKSFNLKLRLQLVASIVAAAVIIHFLFLPVVIIWDKSNEHSSVLSSESLTSLAIFGRRPAAAADNAKKNLVDGSSSSSSSASSKVDSTKDGMVESKPALGSGCVERRVDGLTEGERRSIFKTRKLMLDGFRFCTVLNNATFDTFVDVYPLGGSIFETQPTKDNLTRLIDVTAEDVYNRLNAKHGHLEKPSVHRLACYMAALGENNLVNLTNGRFLDRLNPSAYLGPILPALRTEGDFAKQPKPKPLGQNNTNKPLNPKKNVDHVDSGDKDTGLSALSNRGFAPAVRRPRRHYRIAFLMTIHGDVKYLENVKTLVDELDDGSAVFLIHVDAGSGELFNATRKWLQQREEYLRLKRKEPKLVFGKGNVGKLAAASGNMLTVDDSAGEVDVGKVAGDNASESREVHMNRRGKMKKSYLRKEIKRKEPKRGDERPGMTQPLSSELYEGIEEPNLTVKGNVYLARHRYRGMWGHISLVWMELSGYWELLELAEWDVVINLSAADFPFRRSREMHRFLTSEKNKGKSFIGHWEDTITSANRLTRAHLPSASRNSVEWSMVHPLESGLINPPFPAWKNCKQHQWMVLTREFVQYLKTSSDALQMLAFSEYNWIPDESYFCTVAINSPEFKDTIVPDSLRFLEFPNGHTHPHVLDLTWIDHFPAQDFDAEIHQPAPPQHLFARKIYPHSEAGANLTNWIREKHLNPHVLSDDEYGFIPGREGIVPLHFEEEVKRMLEVEEAEVMDKKKKDENGKDSSHDNSDNEDRVDARNGDSSNDKNAENKAREPQEKEEENGLKEVESESNDKIVMEDKVDSESDKKADRGQNDAEES
ncbi:hypothetical protein HDU76_012795 [Blyttiomyces sp. JEL0837]|nr:hypothetical protein HDU76_012795 [Blyttiomyces sp. JEL0837]